ncbi:MAG: YhfC family intramembrane metalloprotease [Hyphomicrobiales bacterium]|nr:YhfC family intramembrane metalloprotease [Hyphomicrobiales bacterium]MBV8825157.1 YhfC family intramembrane metalloprotease [Hyphomicrobiales bacterium]MBV9428067.1 YhfC family intramembrane metalloprotease [Bradyrhizobiaceae bacterium]
MVASSVLASLILSAVLSIVWPIGIFLICRGRMRLAARNVLVGAGVFLVFSQVLEKALHIYLLKANPATAAWLQAHRLGFALYGCLAAGLFEEIGRYLGMRVLVRPTGNPGTAVAYGIGHGGIEAVLIGTVAAAQLFFFATMLNAGRLETALAPALTPDAVAHVRATLEHLSMLTVASGALERLIALLIQIALSLLVWRAVERRHLGILALAIALHALIDFPVGLVQGGLIPAFVVEILLLIGGAFLLAFFLRGLPRKAALPAPERAAAPVET